MRLRHFVPAILAALLPAVLLLAGCTAPTSSQDAPAAEQPVAAQPAAPTAVAPATPASAATAPVAAAPVAVGSAPVVAPVVEASDARQPAPKAAAELGRNCSTDSDCAVKDVGNCCGAFPMCVNKATKTDPAAVRAQCEKSGMASICGFQEVSGCQCVKGQCENITSGAAAM